MGFFKITNTTLGPLRNMFKGTAPRTTFLSDAEDVQNAQHYVSSVADVFRSSADQQNLAIKRMASLSKTIAKMEADLRHLERLESQNKTLNATASDLEKKLSQKTSWASEQENKLIALERHYKQAQKDLETAKGEIATRKDRAADDNAKLSALQSEFAIVSGRLTSNKDLVSTLKMKNKSLQEEVSLRQGDLSDRNREISQLQKSLEDVSAKLAARVKQGDTTLIELKELRIDFTELKAKFIETSSVLETARYDLNSQKSIFDETLKRRDEENLALKSRIDQFGTEVRIKNGGVTQAENEIRDLRNRLAGANSRAEQAESRLRENALTLSRHTDDLMTAKSDFERLNTKFSLALEDIDALRKINHAQQAKLERYAAIGGVSAGQVYINTDTLRTRTDERRVVEGDKPSKVTRLKAVKSS